MMRLLTAALIMMIAFSQHEMNIMIDQDSKIEVSYQLDIQSDAHVFEIGEPLWINHVWASYNFPEIIGHSVGIKPEYPFRDPGSGEFITMNVTRVSASRQYIHENVVLITTLRIDPHSELFHPSL